MAIVDTDTKSLIINQLTTDQLKELQESGSVEDGQVYVTIDPLYHDLSNIDAMTADRALITDSNGKIDESATTSTELGYVHGVTSAIQTQIDAKASNDDLALKAPLASPELTGTPKAPTASSGTNTTQIATTEFVNTAVSNATPGVDNSTVETFDNSSAQGGSTHDLRVKDDGITIEKMNPSAFTLKTSESKNSATIPSYAKVEEMVANATPVVDNSTISYNSSTELQAIGTINKNGGGTLYNWRGTLAEYEAAVAAGTIQDNWICVITDDFNPGVTFSGEIVSVTKTFTTANNHVEFTEKCRSKNYLTVFQDRVFIYPSEYTLDNDFMGITFTSNIEQGSTVTVNYFKGVPSEKVDELIEAAKDVGIKKYESTSSYSTNELVVNVDNNNPQVYRSLADNNEAALSDTTKWAKDYLCCANSALSNSPYTTNRILEIPQNIKLELNDGTLTLKAGSKVYVPNGPGVFTELSITSDMTVVSTTLTGKSFIFANNSNLFAENINTQSGSTLPSSATTGEKFYNTTENKFYRYNGSEWQSNGFSFPLAIVTLSSESVVTSIDQIFNGFGYIGSTVFALPGVKVQTANGRNEDGTCKSLITNITSVKTLTINASWGTYDIFIMSNGEIGRWPDIVSGSAGTRYNSVTNYYEVIYNGKWVSQLYCVFVKIKTDTTSPYKITSFEPFTVDSVLNSSLSNLDATGQAKFDAKANVSNTVTTDTAQTITGFKAFNNGSGNIRTNIDIITNDGVGEEDVNSKWAGSIQFKKGNVDVGFCEAFKDSENSSITQIVAHNSVNGQEVYASLRSVVTSDGNTFSYAETTPTGATGNEIATAAWVNSKIQLVNELPANPVAGVLYCIPEK